MSELLQMGHMPSNGSTGWNMVEDVRAPVFVQRPHSTNPRPPPLSLSFQLSSSPTLSSSPSSPSSTSPNSTSPSPTSPTSSPRSSPRSSSFLGAIGRMVNYQRHSSTDLSQHRNSFLAKETPPTTTSSSTPSSPNTLSPCLPSRKSTTPTPRPRPYSINLSQSPILTPPPTKISPRSQMSDPEFIKQELQDKTKWEAEAMKEHPEILEIIERIRPLNRAASFGRLFAASKTPVGVGQDDILSRDILVQLILQHLHFQGLLVSRKLLEEESKVKYVDYQLGESRLETLVSLAVKDTEKVWDLAVAGGPTDETQKMIEECMIDMGLFPENEDVDIWDDEPFSNVVYVDEKDNIEGLMLMSTPDGNIGQESLKPIKAASLNQLVIALTPEKLPDLEYFKTFMLTYQSFTTPAKLLQKLIERYHVPRKEGMTEDDWKKVSLPIQVRVGNVLRSWIREHWSDFTPALIQSLKSFIDNSLRLDSNQSLVKSITTALNSKLRPEEGTDEEKEKLFPTPPPEPKVPKTIFSPYLNVVLDVDEEEIARQLTLVDFEVFASIKASEFLNQAWNKPKLKHRSPNLLKAINHFNDISTWAANNILKMERVKDRAKLMAKLIRVAEISMKSLNNFNSAMAILSGLNQAAVHRLKFTREEMPKSVQQTYNELQTLLSSNASYKEYRALLSRSVPPCIPYLGVFLTDLTFIEDGNPDYLYGGLINFSKRRLVYNVIAQITSYQLSPYNLMPVYQISCHLYNPLQWVFLSEDEKYKLSLSREPRNKDRSEIL